MLIEKNIFIVLIYLYKKYGISKYNFIKKKMELVKKKIQYLDLIDIIKNIILLNY